MKGIMLMEKGKEKENFIQKIKICMLQLKVKMEKLLKKKENILYFIQTEHFIMIQIDYENLKLKI